MSYRRKMKHEFLVLSDEGVLIPNAQSFGEVWGSHVQITDVKHKYNIVHQKKGYLIPWKAIEELYNFLNEQLENIKVRLELLSLIRMKRDEILEVG